MASENIQVNETRENRDMLCHRSDHNDHVWPTLE